MAAVVYPMADPWVVGRPGRPEAAVYRRRRAVVLLMLLVALALVTAVGRLALAGSGGGALTTAGSSGALSAPTPAAASGHPYVVRPGDTLWSIVEASGQGGDPRPAIDRLARQLAGRPLQPGERLLLP
ncbi:MAG TPA: hypothetical protein VHT75_03475 [Acidimicrobiales bacterium]|jgi:hypothetical protein|nr:hypothetical protein [Acidimicrobiales bacterium]